MGIPAAVTSTIGTGLGVAQGIGSAVKGQQAGQQLSQNINQTNQLFGNLAGMGANVMNLLSGTARGFADPRAPSTSVLPPSIDRRLSLNSPPGARYQGPMLEAQGGSSDPRTGDKGTTTATGTPTRGTGTRRSPTAMLSDVILNDTFRGATQLGQLFQGGAAQLGDRGLADQSAALLGEGGMAGLLQNLNDAGGLRQFQPSQVYRGEQFMPAEVVPAPGFNPDQYNFDPVVQTRQQAVNFAQQAGRRARATASEQAALGLQQGSAAIDKMLAARGLSADSGVGAAALAQLGTQQAQALTGLNRDLATQGQQAALQASQFDVGSLLNLTGLGSQYNLGLNQLTGQLGLGQAELMANQLTARNQLLGNLSGQRDALIAQQLMQNAQLGAQFGMNTNQLLAGLATSGQANDLARSQQLAALQGLNDQNVLNRTQLAAQGITTPLGLLQGVYQQNYLAPQMEALGLQSGLAGTLAGAGIQGLLGNQAAMGQAVQSAGSGKGAATANLTRPGKNSTTPTAPAPGPQLFSVPAPGLG